MDNSSDATNICQTPKAWANTKTWQETCSKSNAQTQNSHHDLLMPSVIALLPLLILLSIPLIKNLKQNHRRQQHKDRAFARLQQIAMLERMLNIKVK